MRTSRLWPFQNPANHERVSGIIRQRSTNRADVREVALRGLDLSKASEILDLGCGFGFMAGAVATRAAPDAQVLGVDAWPANEAPFVDKVTATGRTARFEQMYVDAKLPWPDQRFDMVVCSYSLYFFVDVLPEVARVLTPNGLFLTVTHSQHSFLTLLRAAGLAEDGSELIALARQFSAENGQAILSRFFGDVSQLDYRNSLRFSADYLDELLAYLRFKLPLLVPGAKPGDELPEALAHSARESLSRTGEVIVEKSDAVFRCRHPQCH